MMREGVSAEIEWGQYVIGDDIQGLNKQMLEEYIPFISATCVGTVWASAFCTKTIAGSLRACAGCRNTPMPIW